MAGARQKPPGQLANTRGGRGRTLDVEMRERKVPPLPMEVTRPRAVWLPPEVLRPWFEEYQPEEGVLGPELTPQQAEERRLMEARKALGEVEKRATQVARATWKAWWTSTTSLACKPEDEEPLRRWIVAVFQLVLFEAVDSAMPLVPGANRTWVRNPIARKVRDLEARVARVEDRYGMNTVQRFRLQLNVLTGREKADRLRNRPHSPSASGGSHADSDIVDLGDL